MQRVTLDEFDVCLFSGVYFSLFPFPPTRYGHEAYLHNYYTALHIKERETLDKQGNVGNKSISMVELGYRMDEYEGNRLLLSELCTFLIKENQGLIFQV